MKKAVSLHKLHTRESLGTIKFWREQIYLVACCDELWLDLYLQKDICIANIQDFYYIQRYVFMYNAKRYAS